MRIVPKVDVGNCGATDLECACVVQEDNSERVCPLNSTFQWVRFPWKTVLDAANARWRAGRQTCVILFSVSGLCGLRMRVLRERIAY